MKDGSFLYSLEQSTTMEPISVSSINSVSCELETTFQDEPSDALHAFSESFLEDRKCEIHPCEDLVAGYALRNEEKQEPRFSAQSSQKVFGTTLDDDTVNFMTHLNFEY